MTRHFEKHYTNRTNWLRAVVLGANDGIISTTGVAIGVAAANTDSNSIVLAALAGLVAGACSMAAGEYVSVSSQTDIESADIERERNELETMPEEELEELAEIYQKRGLSAKLSMQVAKELMAYNPLEAHIRDELGINEMTKPRPLQAALASAGSFISGGILPLLVAIFSPLQYVLYLQYGFAIVFLGISGAISAKLGGAAVGKAVLRICFWGTAAMVITATVGHLFGTKFSL